MIVYVVTTHTPMGRKVRAVFEDRDPAVFCCALLEHDEAELEEFDTEAIKITGTMKPLREWTVYINADGEAIDTENRYVFTETLKFHEDVDGSVSVYLTVGTDVPEDKVKEIALDHWRRKKN